MDLIGGSTAASSLKCRIPHETGRSQAPRRQQAKARILQYIIAIIASEFRVLKSKNFLGLWPPATAVCGGPTPARNCARTAVQWPLASRPLPTIHAHWLRNNGAAGARLCAALGAVITAAAHMDARSRAARWPAATRNRRTVVHNQCAMMGARLRREAPLLARPGRASCGQRAGECHARFGSGGRLRAAVVRRRLRQRCDG
ncbi:hypothetical protein F511_16039 [Dorcoceras hygrometricum]|uniref:Uncharacterized protein n=1 Tax=Dorcoceras hygrometricum TaxID=472368 RepID=A0A2Z7BDY7_9LAMI|nr:hypothetical protein F511_16039 [Dorcoceras hygrometricum]